MTREILRRMKKVRMSEEGKKVTEKLKEIEEIIGGGVTSDPDKYIK